MNISKKSIVCTNCELINKATSTHCDMCGERLIRPIITRDETKTTSSRKTVKKRSTNMTNIGKKEILVGLSTIGILFVITYIIAFIINSQNIYSLDYTLNPFQIMLLMNLAPTNIISYTSENHNLVFGIFSLIIMLIPPITAIMISNYIYNGRRNRRRNQKYNLTHIISSGVIYGISIGFIGVLSSTMYTNYNFISLFLNGFIVGFLGSYISDRVFRLSSKYVNTITKPIAALFLSYCIMFLILTFLYNPIPNTYSDSYLDLSLLRTQYITILLGFAHNSSMVLNLELFPANQILMHSMFTDFNMYPLLIKAVPLFVLIFTGYKLRLSNEDESSNELSQIIIFSTFYAIFMTLLLAITIISDLNFTSYNSNEDILTSLHFISSFIGCFVYGFIGSFIGYKFDTN